MCVTHRFKRSVHLKEMEMCLKDFADDNISEQVMPALQALVLQQCCRHALIAECMPLLPCRRSTPPQM